MGINPPSVKPMAQIRSFVPDDIPEVAKLHERVMRGANKPSSPAKQSYWENIFFHNPWTDEYFPSLVYEDSQGQVVGFLGIIPRRMRRKGLPIQVAICNHFFVEPRCRGLVGVRLMSRFLSGPQDLSIAEANSISRKVWEGRGGKAISLYSINWKTPLRPSEYALCRLARGNFSTLLNAASRPFCNLADTLLRRIRSSPFYQAQPDGSVEELDTATLALCLEETLATYSLRPVYTEKSLDWLLDVLSQKQDQGTLRKVLVRNKNDEIAGWFLYYVKPGAIGEVVQIGSRSDSMPEVLDHLLHDAWQHGVVGLSGRIEPRFLPEFSRKTVFLYCGSTQIVAHSRDPDLLNDIYRGDAYLTRLESEWWIPFGTDSPEQSVHAQTSSI